MAISLRSVSILCVVLLSFHGSLADSSKCAPSRIDSFVNGIRSQCPLSIEWNYPEEVSGEKLDKELRLAPRNAYYAVYFYASWCPFSRKVRPYFDSLSFMFPDIKHLVVEESSAIPSVFSRNGIHSFPSILLTNGTTKRKYHGPKDLGFLVKFYKETTGFKTIAYLYVEELPTSESRMPLNLWDQSVREMIKAEPYLVFSLAFVCLKAIVCLIPVVISRIKAALATCALHLNVGILGEWNYLLKRVLHVIDLRKLWSKLKVCNKSRNFQTSAKNARVWASLASVSLGKSSSPRGS